MIILVDSEGKKAKHYFSPTFDRSGYANERP